MKKTLLLLFFLIAFNKIKAQVVFCPPGAQWNYLFSGTIFWPGTTYNEAIKFVGDSISGVDTLKILVHNRFFMGCGPYTNKTLIKQKGDTIFFYNKFTQGTWQILYNFAAQPGQSWQTTVLKNNIATATFTFSVQSVSTVTLNGFNLKQLNVTGASWGDGTKITERIGSNAFLFHFISRIPASCDGDVFLESLCYTDNAFGTKQFGEKSCDYYTRNYVGIGEQKIQNSEIKIYPNPVNNILNIETTTTEKIEVNFTDVFGREVKKVTLEGNSKIDVSNLSKGIYFLAGISGNSELVFTTKLIKE